MADVCGVLALMNDGTCTAYVAHPVSKRIQAIKLSRGCIPIVPVPTGWLTYEELIEKSRKKTLTSAEAAFFVQNFDAAELYSYEQAKKLSIRLLKEWLVRYKFKNWKKTRTRKVPVTPKMRRDRAEMIGHSLSNTERWCSHSRGISMQTLIRELKLDIEDIDRHPRVREALDNYYGLLINYSATIGASAALHTGDLFLPL